MTSLAALLLAGNSDVHAQDEAPSEDLPEVPSADEAALEDAAESAEAAADGAAGDDGKDAAAEAAAAGPAWETYDSEASQSVAQQVSRGVRVEDIVEPPSDYRYAAFGKPDPFVPPIVTADAERREAGVDPLEIPIVSPLQLFSLDQLSVVGIWQLASGERKAMILASGSNQRAGGQGIIVKSGDPVGNRGGKILGIGDTFVTVREFMLAPDGTRQYEDQQLTLGPAETSTGKIRFLPGQKTTQLLLDNKDEQVPGADEKAAAAPGAPANSLEDAKLEKGAAPLQGQAPQAGQAPGQAGAGQIPELAPSPSGGGQPAVSSELPAGGAPQANQGAQNPNAPAAPNSSIPNSAPSMPSVVLPIPLGGPSMMGQPPGSSN